MFKVNQYVVYNSIEVCQITDIRKEKYLNYNELECYVLKPVCNNGLVIKIPVNNPKVLMREIIKKDDVLALIQAMPENETMWIDDYRQRSESFKAVLRTGECEEWIKLIKTLYLKKEEKSAIGKRLMKSDEDIMKAAEKNLYEEFAIALNISPDEVLPFIREHIPKKDQ